MKATELKIGDYFLFKENPVRVCLVDDEVCVTANGEYIDARVEDLSPCPLTSEILEKNGWHKQASNGEAQGWSNGHVKLYPQGEKFGGGFMFLYSGNAVQYIHHVHGLQHLLWALGMNDNLEI